MLLRVNTRDFSLGVLTRHRIDLGYLQTFIMLWQSEYRRGIVFSNPVSFTVQDTDIVMHTMYYMFCFGYIISLYIIYKLSEIITIRIILQKCYSHIMYKIITFMDQVHYFFSFHIQKKFSYIKYGI